MCRRHRAAVASARLLQGLTCSSDPGQEEGPGGGSPPTPKGGESERSSKAKSPSSKSSLEGREAGQAGGAGPGPQGFAGSAQGRAVPGVTQLDPPAGAPLPRFLALLSVSLSPPSESLLGVLRPQPSLRSPGSGISFLVPSCPRPRIQPWTLTQGVVL